MSDLTHPYQQLVETIFRRVRATLLECRRMNCSEPSLILIGGEVRDALRMIIGPFDVLHDIEDPNAMTIYGIPTQLFFSPYEPTHAREMRFFMEMPIRDVQ